MQWPRTGGDRSRTVSTEPLAGSAEMFLFLFGGWQGGFPRDEETNDAGQQRAALSTAHSESIELSRSPQSNIR